MAKYFASRHVKLVILILIFTLASSILSTSCSKDQSATDQSATSDNQLSGNQPATGDNSAEPREPYEIKMWVFPLGDSAKQKEIFDGIVKDFEAQNSNITVNIQTMPWSNREQKLMTALAAHRGPDTVYMNTDILLQFAYNNMVLPLDEYITEEQKNDFFEQSFKVNSYEGKVYGLPVLQEMMTYIYNLDILKEIGLDEGTLPSTFDEFETMLKNLKAKGKTGFSMDLAGSLRVSGYYAQLWSEGGAPFSPDGKVTINDAINIKVLERIKRWYKAGYLPQDAVTMNDNASLGKFLAGDVASHYISAGNLVTEDLKNVKFNWAIGPILKGAAGGKADYAIGSFCITKDSKDPALVYKFLDLFTNKENLTAINKFSGYLPPRKSIPNIFEDVKGYDAVLGQLDCAYSEPSHPAERQVMSSIIAAIQAALTESKTPGQALGDAAKDAEDTLQKYKDIKDAQQ